MLAFPSSEDILKAREETIADKIFELCKSRSLRWAREKAIQLEATAARNPFEKTVYQSHILSLGMYINILLQYKEHLSKLEAEIDTLAKEMEEYNIVKSIPGIGERWAGAVGKRHVRLFSAGAQGVSTLFFLHLSYFQPRYIDQEAPSISMLSYVHANMVEKN